MEYRRLVLQDLESCFRCRLRALEDTPSAFLTTLEEERARGSARFVETLSGPGPERVIFGALNGGEVVGTIGVSIGDMKKLKHRATIWGMYVDKGFRGSGVGGRLLDLAVSHARLELKAAVVCLSVESGNRLARRLYESRGFVCWGTEAKMTIEADGTFGSEDHMSLAF